MAPDRSINPHLSGALVPPLVSCKAGGRGGMGECAVARKRRRVDGKRSDQSATALDDGPVVPSVAAVRCLQQTSGKGAAVGHWRTPPREGARASPPVNAIAMMGIVGVPSSFPWPPAGPPAPGQNIEAAILSSARRVQTGWTATRGKKAKPTQRPTLPSTQPLSLASKSMASLSSALRRRCRRRRQRAERGGGG